VDAPDIHLNILRQAGGAHHVQDPAVAERLREMAKLIRSGLPQNDDVIETLRPVRLRCRSGAVRGEGVIHHHPAPRLLSRPAQDFEDRRAHPGGHDHRRTGPGGEHAAETVILRAR
jgi:hypothetical protein